MNLAYPASLRRKLDPASLAFLVVAFLTGIASALQVPILSLFLGNELGVRPYMIGLFYTVSAIVGIVVSQVLAHRSDRGGDRRRLILLCCVAGFLGCLQFAFDRHFALLISMGVLLGSFGGTANPQVFALAREHADYTAREATMFNSIMRAQISLAWVIGPPLAFALVIGFGYTATYLAAGVAFLACAALVARTLPFIPRAPHAADHGGGWRDPAIRLPFIASTLMWTCNGMYLIAMPLYVTHTLNMPTRTPGLLMGTAAALEIPAMLVAGFSTRRFGKLAMLRFATAAGVLFYAGMVLLDSEPALIALQLGNAIFIGIIAGTGMLYFQDLLPGRAGTATTLFATSTRTGAIIAGAIAGGIADAWGFHAVFYAILACSLLASACSFMMRER
ncbi:MFS transporter [Paludibacterium yongneupense]|uniref:MFS transporter n=1 Tax=Paludibacterium yongneupense TaxID=400061 RepID=UPI00042808A6|nr:MFS transporter [Paludibacterium yongneupense]